MSDKNWVAYLVRCSDKSIYCGISNNVPRRLEAHNSGKGAKYTRSRRPVELIELGPEMSKGEALKLEYRIKSVPAAKKVFELNKARREFTIKRNIRDLRRGIKAIVKIIDKLIKEI